MVWVLLNETIKSTAKPQQIIFWKSIWRHCEFIGQNEFETILKDVYIFLFYTFINNKKKKNDYKFFYFHLIELCTFSIIIQP